MKDFVVKYWLTALLLLILSTLMYQNFFVNKFPFSLMEKQAIIDKDTRNNQLLNQQNKIKNIELKAVNAKDKEVLESQARYRFGFIKKGETYYQISE